MNTMKKTMLSAAIASAMGMIGTAQAGSLLAPVVLSDLANGVETYLSLKIQGNGYNANTGWDIDGNPNNPAPVHYHWFSKGTTADDLKDLDKVCDKVDGQGIASPWDMIFQSVGLPAVQLPAGDLSQPLYETSPFYGFMVIDDVNYNGTRGDGDFSGFAYIVDWNVGVMQEYKLLNNEDEQMSGDFDSDEIDKDAVDFSWWPTNVFDTSWYVLAVGYEMTGHPASAADGWDGKVVITQNGFGQGGNPREPWGGQTGVYNNDEGARSGQKDVAVTCMGQITREDFMQPSQVTFTDNGGWTRRAIFSEDEDRNGLDDDKKEWINHADGAVIMKSEDSAHLGFRGLMHETAGEDFKSINEAY